MGVDAKFMGAFPNLSRNVPFCPRLSSFVLLGARNGDKSGQKRTNGDKTGHFGTNWETPPFPEGPARHLDVPGQKLSPHCLETIFDSQLPSPKSSPKMPPKLSLPHRRGHFFLFQNYPCGEGNCEAIERQKLSRGNFCPGTSRCLAGPTGFSIYPHLAPLKPKPRLRILFFFFAAQESRAKWGTSKQHTKLQQPRSYDFPMSAAAFWGFFTPPELDTSTGSCERVSAKCRP